MQKTLFRLAKSHIKNSKKHYIIVSVIIFIVTFIMFSYITIHDNNNEVIKEYYLATYGNWYTKIEHIDEETKKGVEIYGNSYFEDEIEYGYVKNQGSYDDYLVGHIDDSLYDLCQIDIISGQKPSQDQEILVSDTLAENENVNVGSVLRFHDTDYTIVGIIHTDNKGLPDVFTNLDSYYSLDYYSNMELGYQGNIGYYNEDNEYEDLTLNYSYNPYGYDHNAIHEKVDNALVVLSMFFEVIVITGFILLALTSSYLKKKQKEFALLRGIGMTTSQLMMMILYENLLVSFLAIISGFLLALAVSLGFMYYQSTVYQIFIYDFDLRTVLMSLMILILCIMIAAIIPIFSSSKNALTGSFDSQKFKYIQVRYRKLKKTDFILSGFKRVESR